MCTFSASGDRKGNAVQPALPFGGNPMKDSNQTPYDWEKDEGVFDQGSSAEQEDEVKSYRSASQEEETPSPAPQEEYEEDHGF